MLTVERIRRSHLGGVDILSLLTGTHYMATYFRLLGMRVGRDTAMYAGGKMSFPLTEPELVDVGERVAMDDASLVAHINSRGEFRLNTLRVGDGCVMRSGARLLSGAAMAKEACLMEHTLVMGGDEVEEGAAVQGWPGEEFGGVRVRLEDEEDQEEAEKVSWSDWVGGLWVGGYRRVGEEGMA